MAPKQNGWHQEQQRLLGYDEERRLTKLQATPLAEAIKVLAVDDNQEALFALEQLLLNQGFEVATASTGEEGLKKAASEGPDIILLDLVMPGMGGIGAVKRLKADPILKYIPAILLTSKDDLETIVSALESGADNFLTKPYNSQELVARLKAMMRMRRVYQELKSARELNRDLTNKISGRYSLGNLIGRSPSMVELYSLIERVSDSDVPVLITGESGTGKEMVAAAVHYHSARRSGPMVVQNCSAFNENLLESELFGHVRGAFSGAERDKEGLFQAADGGTFFLDELGEMSPTLQAKLLRVLQDGTFYPVGSTKLKKVSVRIIAATNRDLKEMIAKGQFREDLFYRINVINLKLPPLRERKEDIPLLVDHFLTRIAERTGKKKKDLRPETLSALSKYNWPGNVRELQNELERLWLISAQSNDIGLEHLSTHISAGPGDSQRQAGAVGPLKEVLEGVEREMIVAALKRANGNKSEAARELGVSRSNLIAKVQSYGLEVEE